MQSLTGAGIKSRIAELAWLIRNQVRALGYYRMGLPCQLMGTGMAFPWLVISRAELASGHIVEDLKLGIDLARDGVPALFCPEAHVVSYFPATAAAIEVQRTRWEHGHLSVILNLAPNLFRLALLRGSGKLFALAIDLCVPPLSLLLMLDFSVFVGCVAFFVVTAKSVPVWIAAISLALLGMSVLLSWARYGRRIISLSSLAYAPLYAIWKIPVYFKFLVSRQAEWIRSKRDGD
jgi:cellulose synthase/poly-beta-1,6-N-acetylglucosamine synthase-like glycosyltransferase